MNDSRAALEEAAAKWAINDDPKQYADFYEQESSSLKLLLSTICKGKARIERWVEKRGELCCNGLRYVVELDSSGIPVITPEIVEALKNAAIS